MKKVHIVTNSVSQIPEALCNELEIHKVPLPFVWDGRTYLDNVDIGPRQFYSRLRAGGTIPKTSGPTPKAFMDMFQRLSSDGDKVLAILVARFFSSTMDAANLAKDQIPNADITIVDSESNGMGLGFLVLAAARAARQGKDIDEILGIVEQAKITTGIVFAVKDIQYLRRGGRINLIESFFSSALNLVPLMEIHNGPIKPIERLRTDKRLVPRLLDLVSDRVGEGRPLRMAILHADAEKKAWELKSAVQEHFEPDELLISEITPVLGVHLGPDAIGLAYSFGI